LTAQGHPRAIFKRAIERGNVLVAEATAREIGLSLEEALQLVVLYAALDVGSDRAHHSSFGPPPYAGGRPQHCRSVNVVPQRPGS
jgi:hypothetical protein